ncbi:hypothetical protein ACFVT1_02565 [Streptomyces sp. NPDC057963]|uniref:hypothetical protein n=1 Tax=Streptomyces sp. NPDC057963 TaxID=3346290 RepID=UPI0036E23F9A
MKFTTRLRVSSALWVLPAAIGLMLLYFFKSFAIDYKVPEYQPKYAPSVTSSALLSFYALSYAIASSLSAWESGRLRRNHVWELAPSRSRIGITFHTLAPVIALSWLMLILPVGMALAKEETAPTPGILPLLITALLVATAHAVVGFGIGLRISHLIATPVLAVGVFFCVAAAWSYEPFWIRHISGQFPVDLMFAESASLVSLVPHVLFIGSLAAGVAILSIPVHGRRSRVCIPALACVISISGLLASYVTVKNWGANPPLSTGNVAMECSGQSPKVCLPAGTDTQVAVVQAEVASVLRKLENAGVAFEPPRSVVDSMANRRYPIASTRSRWQLPLIASQHEGTTGLQTVRKATELPCRHPSEGIYTRSVLLWSADLVGQRKAYLRQQRVELSRFRNREEVIALTEKRVAEVHAMPTAAQLKWYEDERKRACDPKQQSGAN